jgi:hypothetical protein
MRRSAASMLVTSWMVALFATSANAGAVRANDDALQTTGKRGGHGPAPGAGAGHWLVQGRGHGPGQGTP